MDSVSRRHFLARSSAVAFGFAGLKASFAKGATSTLLESLDPHCGHGFGPLVSDPRGILDLPAGFTYTIISRVGERMDDGFLVPGLHDAMGAFPYLNNDGTTVLLTTQYLEEADQLADRVAIIDNGKIVREGRPEAQAPRS